MDRGVRAYTFNDETFTLIDTRHDGGVYNDVWSDDSFVYVACELEGIRAYSFDGKRFSLIDTRHDNGWYKGVWGDGTVVFAACWTSGISAYELVETESVTSDTIGFELVLFLFSVAIVVIQIKQKKSLRK